MKHLVLPVALAALTIAPAAQAQSAQDSLDAHYDRALAAGYKALFLCSAIANAEANGAERTPEHIHQWELTGIYPKLDPIIRELEYEIVRRPTGHVSHVSVQWDDEMPGRVAAFYGLDSGCAVLPIGAPEDWADPSQPLNVNPETVARKTVERPQSQSEGNFGAEATQVLNAAFDGSYGSGTRSTAVLLRTVEDGEISAEQSVYADGFSASTPQRTWSVAKSIAATLVGVAVLAGENNVSDPVNVNYWRSGGTGDPRGAITIDHMLRMASGRYSDTPGNRTDPLYWGGTTINERALSWTAIAKPGTVYRYANNDTLMAIKAVEPYLSYYPPHEFFEQVGMDHTVAETDWRGGLMLSSQVWATAPDLATLGQLYLNDGMWNGERVLPEGWRDYVSDPSGPQPSGSWGYGAGWWTFARPEGNAFEGIPDDAFAARGNRGQYVVVVPSRNVVIVRRGEDPAGNRFDIAAFTRDLLAALD